MYSGPTGIAWRYLLLMFSASLQALNVTISGSMAQLYESQQKRADATFKQGGGLAFLSLWHNAEGTRDEKLERTILKNLTDRIFR